MDKAKCLYHADNSWYSDPWNIKKKFDYITRTVSNKKYEPPRHLYMRLDSTGMEENYNYKSGGSELYEQSPPPIEIMKRTENANINDMNMCPDTASGALTSKPKRSRNGFTSVFHFVSSFIGTKSLFSARMQPLALQKDPSRPKLDVGSIFEMYQESCAVEDSLRNSRKSENKTIDLSDWYDDKSSCGRATQVPAEETSKNGVEVQSLCAVPADETSMTVGGAPVCNLPTSIQSEPETNIHVMPDCVLEPVLGNDNIVPSRSGNNTSLEIMAAVCVAENPSDSLSQAEGKNNSDMKENSGTRRKRRHPSRKLDCTKMSSEQHLNLKNNLLSLPCVQSTSKCIPNSTDAVTNGQKLVNEHAITKTQKRSRKRSRRKARRQRKNSPPSDSATGQKTIYIPDANVDADALEKDIKLSTATSTPSLSKVESQSVVSPICIVQPLCANAAIAFILGVCSDDAESEEYDSDGLEWDVGGDDSWEKSNALWESFQECAQLQLSNLKSPASATPTCDKADAKSATEPCFDEVDGTAITAAAHEPTNEDIVDCEHSCREYPNGFQLSAEQLREVNRRWLDDVKKDVPCHQRGEHKKVHFAEDRRLQQVHRLCTWTYAHRAARKGEWEQFARDRARFRTRIQQVEKTIGWVLTPEHRALVLQKYGSPSSC